MIKVFTKDIEIEAQEQLEEIKELIKNCCYFCKTLLINLKDDFTCH